MSKLDLRSVTNIGGAVATVLTGLANDPSISLQPKDAPKVAVAVENAVKGQVAVIEKEVNARIDHLTNNETHWYQKRSRWAAIIATAAPIVGIGLKMIGVDFELGANEQVALTDALMAVGGIWAAYVAYRAGTATKPLGE